VNGKWVFRLCRYGRDITRATGCPKREVVTARAVRDKLLAEFSAKRFGVGDEIPVPVTLEEVVRLYLDSESRPSDREAGGRQPKRKRGMEG
jgi:hypothetical protein